MSTTPGPAQDLGGFIVCSPSVPLSPVSPVPFNHRSFQSCLHLLSAICRCFPASDLRSYVQMSHWKWEHSTDIVLAVGEGTLAKRWSTRSLGGCNIVELIHTDQHEGWELNQASRVSKIEFKWVSPCPALSFLSKHPSHTTLPLQTHPRAQHQAAGDTQSSPATHSHSALPQFHTGLWITFYFSFILTFLFCTWFSDGPCSFLWLTVWSEIFNHRLVEPAEMH